MQSEFTEVFSIIKHTLKARVLNLLPIVPSISNSTPHFSDKGHTKSQLLKIMESFLEITLSSLRQQDFKQMQKLSPCNEIQYSFNLDVSYLRTASEACVAVEQSISCQNQANCWLLFFSSIQVKDNHNF